MWLEIRCPQCGVASPIDPQLRQRSQVCPACGGAVELPPDVRIPEVVPAQVASENRLSWLKPLVLVVTGVVALLGGAAIFLTLAGVRLVHPGRDACRNQLRELYTAMQAYVGDHGCFPPAYLASADGQPLHSWRVLLLPYLGGDDLYERYRFDEPWDSEHNRDLVDEMPSAFACPASPESKINRTSYVAVVGPGLFFDGATARSQAEAEGAFARSLLLVEIAPSSVCWMAPVDLPAAEAQHTVNRFEANSISSFHRGVAHVLHADGTAAEVSADATPEEVAELFTPPP